MSIDEAIIKTQDMICEVLNVLVKGGTFDRRQEVLGTLLKHQLDLCKLKIHGEVLKDE